MENFLLKRTYFDKNFWTHRSMTPKIESNELKKFFPPKIPNHLQNGIFDKISVKINYFL
jgi:hypothetical protein